MNLHDKIKKDKFIYSGNPHESVPKALFFDKRLTPIERNAWQVIKMLLNVDGITTMATYDALRDYLTSVPYAEKASYETVARALTLLRLTRWLSLVEKRRDKDGAKRSNLYILHDEPLTPFEAMRLDDDYLTLVCNSITHASKSIRQVTENVLNDIANDPHLSGKKLPSRLDILLRRMGKQTDDEDKNLSTVHKSEESKNDLLRNQKHLSSDSETHSNALKNKSLRIPKKDIRSSSNINILLQQINSSITLPRRFYELKVTQQKGILKTIQCLPPAVSQQVFNEWDKRCQSQNIHKPAAYLFGIAQKALRGEFNQLTKETTKLPPSIHSLALNEQSEPQQDIMEQEIMTPRSDAEKIKLQAHIQTLKKLFSYRN